MLKNGRGVEKNVAKCLQVENFSYLCSRFREGNHEALCSTLADGNLRNFYVMQEVYNGSRI